MMRLGVKLGSVTMLTLLAVTMAIASDAPRLKHNPFSRPPSESTAPAATNARTGDPAQPVDLRATLVGTRDVFANVAGKTLRPGDEIAGYTLVQVLEDRAIFSREGQRLTVFVKPRSTDDDEN